MHHQRLNPKVSVSIVFVAMFISIMDGTIVNVALPSIGRQLGIPSVSLDAVVVAYLLSLAMVIPASGWLGDRWGTRRIFLLAQLSWRWVFFVNVPIDLAAFLFGLLFLQEHREPATGHFDLPGFLLAGIGLALALYALSEGPTRG